MLPTTPAPPQPRLVDKSRRRVSWCPGCSQARQPQSERHKAVFLRLQQQRAPCTLHPSPAIVRTASPGPALCVHQPPPATLLDALDYAKPTAAQPPPAMSSRPAVPPSPTRPDADTPATADPALARLATDPPPTGPTARLPIAAHTLGPLAPPRFDCTTTASSRPGWWRPRPAPEQTPSPGPCVCCNPRPPEVLAQIFCLVVVIPPLASLWRD